MTDLRTAAQQALWALELDAYGEPARAERDAAIDALRAALAEPETEPVAWQKQVRHKTLGQLSWVDVDEDVNRWSYEITGETRPLYAAPPRREWVSLTDEEIEAAWKSCDPKRLLPSFAAAIEAALKGKNHDSR